MQDDDMVVAPNPKDAKGEKKKSSKIGPGPGPGDVSSRQPPGLAVGVAFVGGREF
jgi:hypothetical protein